MPLPTRVIDVGDDSREPRLHISSEGEIGEYVSLSHCWGRSQHSCKLSYQTLEQWQRSIPLSILPRNFYEAIFITRKLGQRFLWIDSLCIVQPTPGDDRD